MLHVMDGGRASPLYQHPVRKAVEGYTVNRVYRISRIGLYRVYRVYRVYRIRLHKVKHTVCSRIRYTRYTRYTRSRSIVFSQLVILCSFFWTDTRRTWNTTKWGGNTGHDEVPSACWGWGRERRKSDWSKRWQFRGTA